MTNPEEIAVFGGGCFWCTEAIFQRLKGVTEVIPGYAGGHEPHPSYEQVCSGTTGHAEVVKVIFNPTQVTYHTLLTVFFATHDPTTKDRQGNDVGPQYRSSIFTTTTDQFNQAMAMIELLEKSGEYEEPITTTIEPITEFYEAEAYHKQYYNTHQNQGYCQLIIDPKVKKLLQEFSHYVR